MTAKFIYLMNPPSVNKQFLKVFFLIIRPTHFSKYKNVFIYINHIHVNPINLNAQQNKKHLLIPYV